MEINVNLLFCLGSYNTTLITFAELLSDKSFLEKDDMWLLIRTYLNTQRRELRPEGDTEPLEPVDGTVWLYLRHLFGHREADRRNAFHLLMYARVLAAKGPHGDAPWRRCLRLVEQEHQQWSTLNLIDSMQSGHALSATPRHGVA